MVCSSTNFSSCRITGGVNATSRSWCSACTRSCRSSASVAVDISTRPSSGICRRRLNCFTTASSSAPQSQSAAAVSRGAYSSTTVSIRSSGICGTCAGGAAHLLDLRGQRLSPQRLATLRVDDLALLVHHVVVLEQVLADVEVVPLDLALLVGDGDPHPTVLVRLP